MCVHLERKKKKRNNLVTRQNYGSLNSPRCPALWFVYILMQDKEEWVLVWLRSQHNAYNGQFDPCFQTIFATMVPKNLE